MQRRATRLKDSQNRGFPLKKRRYLAQLNKMLKSARYLQKAMAGHIPVAVSPPEV